MDGNSQVGQDKKECLVCDIHMNVRQHFGSITCLACASFFRRTVSLGIQYVCKHDRNCPVSHAVRSGCRACRFQGCERAGMDRSLVRGKRDLSKVPKYVRESICNGNVLVVRDYTTSNFETLHFNAKKEESEMESPVAKTDDEEMFTILNVTADQLMHYYLELNDRPQCPLSDISFENFFKLKKTNERIALDICQTCPGTDLLDKTDMVILFQYCAFASFWMDSLWADLEPSNPNRIMKSSDEDFDLLNKFIDHLRQQSALPCPVYG
ncbi:unnamed protein product [Caenorhabditis sp. 36 PRJEB53466]|nr:unnamed protein product [Caenorhabditis sp. 36 PRJEB53466]